MSSHNENVESGSQGGHLLPCYPCDRTPGGMARVVSDPTLFDVAPDEGIRPLQPAVTSELASPVEAQKRAGPSKGHPGPSKKNHHSQQFTNNILNDSGSEDEEDYNDLTDDHVRTIRKFLLKVRTKIIAEDEGVDDETETETEEEDSESLMNESSDDVSEGNGSDITQRQQNEGSESEGASHSRRFTAAAPVDTNFSWSEDFSSFAGQKEVYSRVPGPTSSFQDPAHIFQEIWDPEFMETVVRETNLYARQTILQLSDPDICTGIPDSLDSWTDITVGELYRFFAIFLLLSCDYRSELREYWIAGITEMPEFYNIMSWDRFRLIGKFLHFVSNVDLSTRGHERKIEKIAPVVDHCNQKFAAMYTPSQHLSLEELLLSRKGSLSRKPSTRSKAARFGIKSFELCEAETGYLIQYRLYTDKRVEMHSDALHGFQDQTAKVILDLIDGYLDVGHILVMDDWYNQLPLTRYLKTRHTDVLGTLNRRRQGIPPAIKDLNPKNVNPGTSVSLHCGDITLVAWKDVKLVTIMSTYHQHSVVPERQAGQAIPKPMAVDEYNRYMGKVHRKDQTLSMFVMRPSEGSKWYLKVFERIFNNSLLNAFIIYTRDLKHQVYSQSDFRILVAEGLLSRNPLECPGPSKVPDTAQLSCLRLQPGNHFPVHTERVSGHGNKYKRLNCVRCYALKKRVSVRAICKLCQAPLCFGDCWEEYHTVLNLK